MPGEGEQLFPPLSIGLLRSTLFSKTFSTVPNVSRLRGAIPIRFGPRVVPIFVFVFALVFVLILGLASISASIRSKALRFVRAVVGFGGTLDIQSDLGFGGGLSRGRSGGGARGDEGGGGGLRKLRTCGHVAWICGCHPTVVQRLGMGQDRLFLSEGIPKEGEELDVVDGGTLDESVNVGSDVVDGGGR